MQGGRIAAEHLFAQGASRIAFLGDTTLPEVAQRVPEDVAVVGYDDIRLARYCQPPLTTVRQPIEAAGKALIDLLMAQPAGNRPSSLQLQTELIQRATTRAVAPPTARTRPLSAASRRSR